jgi:hypothetical protein
MSDQTLLVMIGLAFNFVTMVIGGLSVLFAAWRWFSAMQANTGERLARVETEIKNLLRAHGLKQREESICPPPIR